MKSNLAAALTRVIGPPLSGYLIEQYGTASIGLFGAAVALCMYIYSSAHLTHATKEQ